MLWYQVIYNEEIKGYRYSAIAILIIVSFVFLFTKCINWGTDETGVIKTFMVSSLPAVIKIFMRAILKPHISSHRILLTVIISRVVLNKQKYSCLRFSQCSFFGERDSSFYQVNYHFGTEKTARRIDIIVGSGIMGQSYLYWMQNRLFQLPVSYFGAANKWSNSPGFPNEAIFDRFITSRCLECHSTFAKTLSPPDIDP